MPKGVGSYKGMKKLTKGGKASTGKGGKKK